MPAAAAPPMSLAAALVRLGRERHVSIERLKAEQLVRDAQNAWPGDPAELWDKWLREAASSVSLPSRVADLSAADAAKLVRDGALLVGAYRPESGPSVLVGARGARVEVATDDIRGSQSARPDELVDPADAGGTARWLIVDHPQFGDAADSHRTHERPVRRLYKLFRPEWPDVWLVLVFGFFGGVLSLATPIAVEALVDTVSFGRLLQPVVILSLVLFGFLAFAAVMQGLQVYVVEIIQRRLFARVAADLAYRLPRVESSGFHGEYGPELVNRFLDVVTLQKVAAQVLTDGVSIVLATAVGMAVLAFYSPWLLGFDVLLLAVVTAGLYVVGRGAITSGIKESKLKYRLTAWFEDVVRCPNGFKTYGGPDFANDRASALTTEYLKYRRSHFDVLFRQLVLLLGLQAVAGTVLLGFGGWLVINDQMSLGQLVAAELIVATILGSLAKLGKHLEGFFDAVAAVDKLGHLFDLPVERLDGVLSMPGEGGLRVRLSEVEIAGGEGPLASGLSAVIEGGEQVAVWGPAASGKSGLLAVLHGERRPDGGHVEIEGIDPRDFRPDVLREHVAMVGEPEVFAGTIAENVHLHRPDVTPNGVREALFRVGLLDFVLRLPEGIDTPVNAGSHPLTPTHQRLLTLARALAGKPRLLLLDGMLDALPDEACRLAVESLADSRKDYTLVVATGRQAVAELFDRVVRLE